MGNLSAREVSRFSADLIAALLHELASDTHALNAVVAGGPYQWRLQFGRAFRGLPVDDDVANKCFAFLCKQQIRQHGAMTAAKVLDTYEPPPAPPTEAEIARSWVVESASSEEGRRWLYGADGHPQAVMDRMAAEES